MSRYFFLLGRNQALSLAEIHAYFQRLGSSIKNPVFGSSFFIFETESSLDLPIINCILGGVIKAGEIITEEARNGDIKWQIRNSLTLERIKDYIGAEKRKKCFIGFSLYGPESGYSSLKREIEKHFLQQKKELRKEKISLRLVTSRDKQLSSVVVKKNKLLTEGAEVDIFVSQDKIFFGLTKSVQDFEGLSFRDYKRPCRDMQIGLIPPKLGQILVNLAGLGNKEDVLLDPFCGCGTILQEALVLGYNKVRGSDLDMIAVNNTRKNIDWLIKYYPLNKSNREIIIKQGDVRKIQDIFPEKSVKAVVTEPYLGPPLRLKINENSLRQIMANVMPLYLDFFRKIKGVLMPPAKLVVIWPVFRRDETYTPLPILDEVVNLGYRITPLIPDEWAYHDLSGLTLRGSIIYSRPDQKVLREIFVFQYV